MTEGKPAIVKADCPSDYELCTLFMAGASSSWTWPYMVMATPAMTHVYSGAINADEIYGNFIKDEKYRAFPTHGDDKMGTYQVLGKG